MTLVWKQRLKNAIVPAIKWVADGFKDEETGDFTTLYSGAKKTQDSAKNAVDGSIGLFDDFISSERESTHFLPKVWREIFNKNLWVKTAYVVFFLVGIFGAIFAKSTSEKANFFSTIAGHQPNYKISTTNELPTQRVIQGNRRLKQPDNTPRSWDDVFLRFSEGFNRQFPLRTIVRFIDGNTRLQKYHRAGKPFPTDPTFDPAHYMPILESHSDGWDILVHTRSAKEANHIIKLMQEENDREIKLGLEGSSYILGNVVGALFSPGGIASIGMEPQNWGRNALIMLAFITAIQLMAFYIYRFSHFLLGYEKFRNPIVGGFCAIFSLPLLPLSMLLYGSLVISNIITPLFGLLFSMVSIVMLGFILFV